MSDDIIVDNETLIFNPYNSRNTVIKKKDIENILKYYGLPCKTTYSERKKFSIEITKEQINEKYPTYNDFFLKHKKKDDLADCFLQLIDALNKY